MKSQRRIFEDMVDKPFESRSVGDEADALEDDAVKQESTATISW